MVYVRCREIPSHIMRHAIIIIMIIIIINSHSCIVIHSKICMQRGTCQFCWALAPFYTESVMNKFEIVIFDKFNKLSIQKNRAITIFNQSVEIIKYGNHLTFLKVGFYGAFYRNPSKYATDSNSGGFEIYKIVHELINSYIAFT